MTNQAALPVTARISRSFQTPGISRSLSKGVMGPASLW
jgi:hypothetical protein